MSRPGESWPGRAGRWLRLRLTASPDSLPDQDWKLAASQLARPLIHEVLLLGLCALMTARLARVGQRRFALLTYGAPAVVYAGLIARGCVQASQPQSSRWQRARLLYPFVLINVVFQGTRPAVEALGRPSCDPVLSTIDRWLLGDDLGLLLDRHCGWAYHPLIAEIFSFNYSLFFIYLTTSVLDTNRRPLTVQISFSRGLWSLYALGLLGYTLVPARGPLSIFGDQYVNQIRGWHMTRLNAAIVARGSAVFDVFPSLHLAVPAYLLFWQRRYAPVWFKLWLPPMAVAWGSTIYLRYHYVIDLVAGAALARLCLGIALGQPVGAGYNIHEWSHIQGGE